MNSYKKRNREKVTINYVHRYLVLLQAKASKLLVLCLKRKYNLIPDFSWVRWIIELQDIALEEEKFLSIVL